jgi:muramoyltetrapeptide carboxypeptidase LdcA involved in peptidoglycan recycling
MQRRNFLVGVGAASVLPLLQPSVFGQRQPDVANLIRPKALHPGDTIGALKVPVLSGLTIGHTSDQITLPLGVAATLYAGAGTLKITEAGVS